MRDNADLPLFRWKPDSAKVIVFPMVKRVGRVREVAAKMLDKPTDRAAAFYRDQVTDALLRALSKAGVSGAIQDQELGAFWSAVDAEMIRQTYQGQRPGGSAA